MPSARSLAATFPLLLALAACGSTENDAPTTSKAYSPVVAEVNGESILQRDLDDELAALPEEFRAWRDHPEIRRHVLRRMIREHLLAQRARKLGLHLDPELRRRLTRLQRRLLAEAAREWVEASIDTPTDAEIRAYYDAHPDAFIIPEQIHVRHILVDSKDKARQILRELKRNPSNWVALAAGQSLDDASKGRGGDLNWLPRGVMPPAFDEIAFALDKGGIGGPVKTRFGWHVIQVLERKPSTRRSLDESRDEIVAILRRQSLEQWIGKLEKEAEIRIADAISGADARRQAPAPSVSAVTGK